VGIPHSPWRVYRKASVGTPSTMLAAYINYHSTKPTYDHQQFKWVILHLKLKLPAIKAHFYQIGWVGIPKNLKLKISFTVGVARAPSVPNWLKLVCN